MEIRQQSQFPHIERFKEVFDIDDKTIFAWDEVIYSNYNLPNHLIIHERTHHEQQRHYGLEYWLENYIKDPEFRLKMELQAYVHQIKFVSDRNEKTKLRMECARNLSSSLYANLISYEQAYKKLL